MLRDELHLAVLADNHPLLHVDARAHSTLGRARPCGLFHGRHHRQLALRCLALVNRLAEVLCRALELCLAFHVDVCLSADGCSLHALLVLGPNFSLGTLTLVPRKTEAVHVALVLGRADRSGRVGFLRRAHSSGQLQPGPRRAGHHVVCSGLSLGFLLVLSQGIDPGLHTAGQSPAVCSGLRDVAIPLRNLWQRFFARQVVHHVSHGVLPVCREPAAGNLHHRLVRVIHATWDVMTHGLADLFVEVARPDALLHAPGKFGVALHISTKCSWVFLKHADGQLRGFLALRALLGCLHGGGSRSHADRLDAGPGISHGVGHVHGGRLALLAHGANRVVALFCRLKV